MQHHESRDRFVAKRKSELTDQREPIACVEFDIASTSFERGTTSYFNFSRQGQAFREGLSHSPAVSVPVPSSSQISIVTQDTIRTPHDDMLFIDSDAHIATRTTVFLERTGSRNRLYVPLNA